MTYFTINDEEEALSIQSTSNFCDDSRSDIKKHNKSQDFRNENNSILETPKKNFLKTILFWTCGIEKMKRLDDKIEVPQIIDKSIDEDPKMKIFCDVNAILAIGLSCFCFGFFNKYI